MVGSISNSSLIICDRALTKQVEPRMKGGDEGTLSDRLSHLQDIMDESIDAVLCTFSADPAKRGGGQLLMMWQL